MAHTSLCRSTALPRISIDATPRAATPAVLDLVNQLGILWSNRAQALRALCYFSACERLCAALDVDDADDPIQSVRAHAHFYLAQVFGSLSLPDASAMHCLATLELQLRALLAARSSSDSDSAIDWIKNALRLVEYYVSTESLEDAAICLHASARVVATLHDVASFDTQDDSSETLTLQCAEMALHWAKLHHVTLTRAQLARDGLAVASGASSASPIAQRMAATLGSLPSLDAASPKSSESAMSDLTATLGAMALVPSASITTFEAARSVFKLAMRACASAKRVFVLDGFVTQHVRVAQLESALYKRLIAFETDAKRVVAMQLRRLALLTPVLSAELNPVAFCALVQELSYECAEVAAEVFDLKLEKRRAGASSGDDKATTYALKAISWYQQYVLLFYPPSSPTESPLSVVPTGAAVALPTQAITARELRSLVLGYFGLARVCGRVDFGAGAHKDKTVVFWQQSLAYHSAVVTLARLFNAHASALEARAFAELVGAEVAISTEMVELLPEKINQLVYHDRVL